MRKGVKSGRDSDRQYIESSLGALRSQRAESMGRINVRHPHTGWLLLLVLPLQVLPHPTLGHPEDGGGQPDTPANFYDGRHNDLLRVPNDIPLDTQTIYLSYNNLSTIYDRDFSKFRSLSNVDLAFNGISSISPKAFLETKISSLDLCWNQLKDFPDLRATHTSLTFLDVCRNQIKSIPASALQGLRLKSLDLSNNQLTEFPDLSLVADTLSVLDLTYNPITNVPASALSRLVNLERLYMESCQLTSVPDFSFMPIPNSMRELHLSRNQISSFPPRALKTLSGLTDLFLPHNQLEAVPQSSLTGLQSLDSLDLSHNRLNRLPDIRAVRYSLTFLDISHNDLSRVDEREFPALVAALSKLDYLVVKDARLRTIGDLRTAVRTDADLHLDVSGNNGLECDCRLAWAKQSSIVKDLTPDSKPCGEPQKLRGMRWDTITIEHLCEGQNVPKPKPLPVQEIVNDPTLFSNDVKSKMEEPKPEDKGYQSPQHLTGDGSHWETVHVVPTIINKDEAWSFLSDHMTLLSMVAVGTLLWLGIALYVCVTTRKNKKLAKEVANCKTPVLVAAEPGGVTFMYRQQETSTQPVKQLPTDT